MISLLVAESKRFWARRITRFFPLIVAFLMAGGVAIALMVIGTDEGPDFVQDIGGGIEATSILGPVANLLPIMAFVLGASFVGADLKSGMIEQILTWEPRRFRVVAARSVASFTGTAVLASVLAALLVGLLYVLAAVTGSIEGTTTEFWVNALGAVVRTGISVGLFSLIGLGLTLLVNSSTGSIVSFLIYWFVVESFLLSAFLPRIWAWAPVTNAASFASGADVQRIDGSPFRGDFDIIVDHGYLTAGLVLGGWSLLSLGLGSVWFSARDVS